MIHKAATTVGLALIFFSGYVLFSMKREVETLNFELYEIQKQVTNEKGNINLLKTEYVYLTSPARLSKLAAKYLNLSSTIPDQMMPDPTTATQLTSSEASIEKDSLGTHKAPIITSSSKSVRWRYKRMGDRYVHKASLNKKQ